MSIITKISTLFRARIHIGYLAVPYALLGFFVNWAIHDFSLNTILRQDPNSIYRILISCIIAFIYMPYLFIINDYFDAEDDKLDEKKSKRNPFCNDSFRENPRVKFLIFSPVIIILVLGFLISIYAGLTTILALFLGTFYSAPPFRFKERKFTDFTAHGFCLGIYFYSLGFYSIWVKDWNPFTVPVFWLVLYLSFVDAAWIHLDSALVDYWVDKKGNVNTTVVSLGPQKSLIILIILLISILFIPSLYIFSNLALFNKLPLLGYFLIVTYLILPVTYLFLVQKNKSNFEIVRTLSSRFRVYVMYSVTIMVIILSNHLMFS